MKLGRRRPLVANPHPPVARYGIRSTAMPPDSVDYQADAMPNLLNIFGNDVLGDCTAACYAHAIGVWTGNAGNLAAISTDDVIRFYSACSGYIPGNEATDQGADELTVLQQAKVTGLAGHTVVGSVTVNAVNPLEVMNAIWLFGCVAICLELPDDWLPQTGPGFTWDVAPEQKPDPTKGHCFLGCGYDQEGVYIDTWGLVSETTPSRISWSALVDYANPGAGGSCYAMISSEWELEGRAPNGYDLAQLIADASAIGVVL